MKIAWNEIILFQNIAQFDFHNQYFDFHNDYECIKVKLLNDELVVYLRGILDKSCVELNFQKTLIVLSELAFDDENRVLTIDNLYRGKTEVDGKLIEFNNNRGYFYLEFYEGEKIEFWSESLTIKIN